jgi:hypothetical protein
MGRRLLNEIPSGLSKKGDGAPLGIVRGLTTALSPYVCTFRLSIGSISAVIRFWGQAHRPIGDREKSSYSFLHAISRLCRLNDEPALPIG